MTPGNLVRAVASAFKTSESDVAQYDRRLLESGLRTTTGGRGASAPDVQASDVVRLVIATLVRNRHSQTVATVTDWWNLPLVSDPPRKLKSMLPPRVREIATSDSCNFGEAFTALVEDCKSGEMESLLGSPKAWGPKFGLKIIPQDMRAEIGFSDGSDTHVDLAFQRGVDSDSPREFRTTHQTSIRPLLDIAKQMRG